MVPGIVSCFLVILLAGAVYADEATKPVTYTETIAPILRDHCVSCHRPEQIAPMSLRTYEETRPWAKSILQRIVSREMPPFPGAGPVGRYVDDPRLSESEIDLLKRWVEQGAPRGDAVDTRASAAGTTANAGPSQLGKPDLLVEFPHIKLLANNKDDRVLLYSDYIFPDDVWVRAIDLLPKRDSQLHHANIFVVPPNVEVPEHLWTREGMGANVFVWQLLLSWLPGLMPRPLPEGHAIRIPEGSRLMVQAHFAPTTEETADSLSVGLEYADGRIHPDAHKELLVNMTKFVIPPNKPQVEFSETAEFTEDARVRMFGFHMHVRGKSTRIVLHYPDGTSEEIMSVPRWKFHWQRSYYLSEPVIVPAGTRAEFIAVWDNSAQNPDNPDPNKTVHWGSRTVDEMYSGTIHYTPVKLDDAGYVNVSEGRPVDSKAASQAPAHTTSSD